MGAAHGEASLETQRRFAELRHVLLNQPDGANPIRRSLQRLRRTCDLPSHQRKTLERAIRYFGIQGDRMAYPAKRAQNLPIGSGVMEASWRLRARRSSPSAPNSAVSAEARRAPRRFSPLVDGTRVNGSTTPWHCSQPPTKQKSR